ncbi:MAG: glycosyltransferase family 2 protein [Rickettsiales bacterium]
MKDGLAAEAYLLPYFAGRDSCDDAEGKAARATGFPIWNARELPEENAALQLIRLRRTARDYATRGYFPVALDGNALYLATCRATPAFFADTQQSYAPLSCRFVIASPKRLHAARVLAFRDKAADSAAHALLKKSPHASAYRPAFGKRLYEKILAAAMLACLFLSWEDFYAALSYAAFATFSLALTLKTGLFVIGTRAFRRAAREEATGDDDALPVYSVIVPLYREAAVVPSLVAALRRLRYPPEKLDLHLLAEEDDAETQDALAKEELPGYMSITTIPPSEPRTKPKACNFALPFLRGERVTIFDAEDDPHPDHLRAAAAAFASDEKKSLYALQGRLHFSNARDNYLTHWFALEYAAHFDALLWGMQRLDLPVALGGTSNHFRYRDLTSMGGWDPYNVTEDADVGMRVYRRRKKTRVLFAVTEERAPKEVAIWLKQRSRWIKGHLQTSMVHSRKPRAVVKRMGIWRFLGMHAFLSMPAAVYLLFPWPLAAWGWNVGACDFSGWCERASGGISFHAGMALLVTGTALQSAMGVYAHCRFKGAWRRDAKGCANAALMPLYTLFLVPAAYMALRDLILAPYKWNKTPHEAPPP